MTSLKVRLRPLIAGPAYDKEIMGGGNDEESEVSPDATEMGQRSFTNPVRAILMFGPATPSMGNRAAEFYQATIDPNMASPGGQFIRFGAYKGDEIQGWQRIASMTVLEVLGEPLEAPETIEGRTVTGASVTMRTLR